METNYENIHQELLRRCIKREKGAQFEIYKLYHRSMYNTSLRIVGHREEAEEILQDSFLVAFNKMEEYSGRVSFGAWLKRIVINKSIDLLRRRKMLIVTIPDQLPDTEEEGGEEETVFCTPEEIRSAIMGLNLTHRTILNLILMEGYSYEETGEAMGITYANARTLYSRARAGLRKQLSTRKSYHLAEEKRWMN